MKYKSYDEELLDLVQQPNFINMQENLFSMMALYLKKHRIRKNLSLRDLEKLSGVSASHINRIENQEKKCSMKIFKKLDKYLRPKTRKEKHFILLPSEADND